MELRALRPKANWSLASVAPGHSARMLTHINDSANRGGAMLPAAGDSASLTGIGVVAKGMPGASAIAVYGYPLLDATPSQR